MVVNQKQFAKIIGVTTRRVRQMRDEEGLFRLEEQGKGYELERCVPEYIDYKLKAEVTRGTSFIKEKEQADHEHIKKEISKLKLRKLKNELHEAADVEYFLTNMLIGFKNRLLTVPSKVAGLVVGETDVNAIVNLIENEMLQTLDELSEYDPEKIDGEVNDYFFEEDEENDE